MVGATEITAINDDDERTETVTQHWRGQKGIRGPSWMNMPLLTIDLLGTQIVWCTEMGYASPYLLSLGISKPWMSLVLVTGPLSGLLVQPLIGILADRSTSSWGRRRPYMFCGSILCSLSLLLLGFTKEVVSFFISPESPANATITIWLAVISIYCVDFSVNAVRAVDRALLVDTLPTAQQARGQAWAGRMVIVGSVAGFWIGHISLPLYFPSLGKTQLQVLSVLASCLLLGAQLTTALSVRERVLLPSGLHQDLTSMESGTGPGWRRFAVPKPSENKPSVFKVFKDIWSNIKILPPNIRRICMVQFFSWIGWFPVLLFSTVYVGEVYTLSLPPAQVKLSMPGEATLVGATALFDSSILALVTIILLPFVVAYFKKHSPRRIGFYFGMAEIWVFSLLLFAGCMGATWFTSHSVTGSINVTALTGFCFAVTQWIPFSLLAEQISSHGENEDRARVEYEPLAMQEQRIQQSPLSARMRQSGTPSRVGFDSGEGSVTRERRGNVNGRTLSEDQERARLLKSERDEEREGREWDERELMKDLEASEYAVESLRAGGSSNLRRSASRNGTTPESQRQPNISGKAGIILGIHHVSMVMPQFLVTTLSSIIFAICEPVSGVHLGAGHAGAGVGEGTNIRSRSPVGGSLNEEGGKGRLLVRAVRSVLFRRSADDKNEDGNPDGIALIFKIGGVSSVIAAILCWRLAMELRKQRKF
ncbi:hypothetical protein FRC19_005644 [Serendipita sp. 401]|nr:hypothetical protein FRC19_005644 [Serendipita sp. 401]KAG9053813.1 hypothetical protein FS842_007051 [Serendipita sp. 407]